MKVLHLQGQKDFSRHFQIAEKSLKRILKVYSIRVGDYRMTRLANQSESQNNDDVVLSQ